MTITTNIVLGAALAVAAPALADTVTHTVKTTHSASHGAVEAGANSFTEAQARGRIAKAGFAHVSALKKDDDGVWRGTARKGGKTVRVGLDFKGNVSTGG